METQVYQEVKKVLASDADYLKLPSKFEIDEYEIIERFCLPIPDAKVAMFYLGNLEAQEHSAGSKIRTIYQYGIGNKWFKYRDEAYREIAIV